MKYAILLVALALSGCAYLDAAKQEAIKQATAIIAPPAPPEERPFGGLDYTRQRQVVLKDGSIITEAQIEKIIEVLTPVAPAPIVRVIEFNDIPSQPIVAPSAPPTTQLPPTKITPKTISDALDAIEAEGKK